MRRDDPILAELYAYREQVAARFNFDFDAIFDHYKKLQDADVAAGIKYVVRSPAPFEPLADAQPRAA